MLLTGTASAEKGRGRRVVAKAPMYAFRPGGFRRGGGYRDASSHTEVGLGGLGFAGTGWRVCTSSFFLLGACRQSGAHAKRRRRGAAKRGRGSTAADVRSIRGGYRV